MNFLVPHDWFFASGTKEYVLGNNACHWLIMVHSITIMILYQKVMYKTQGRILIPSIVQMPPKVSLAVNEIFQQLFLKILQEQDSDHQVWSITSFA